MRHLRVLWLCCLGLLAFSSLASGQVWTKRFNGVANKNDIGKCVGLDNAGNVYVAGTVWNGASEDDYAVLKYDSNGTLLWKRLYDGKTHRDDYVNAMTVDSAGNTYVTGTSIGTGNDGDYLTLKYDTNGTLLWAKTYNGTGDWDDEAQAIAVDSAGNVYITGWSWGMGINYNYATLKYSPTGKLLWSKTNNGSADSDDLATAIAVDTAGNVFVTGGSFGASGSFDYLTIKYSPTGQRLWYRRYDGIFSGIDYATAITTDATGNVYVTGSSKGVDKNDDIVTIKYDTNGKSLWGKRYDGSGKGDDTAVAVVVDGTGNVYVAGTSKGNNTKNDLLVLKYNSAGHIDWEKRYNNSTNDDDGAAALALDANGNIYVTGFSTSANGTDYITLKYSPTGAKLWSARYNNSSAKKDDAASAIAVDSAGNIYVTGTSWGGASSKDIVTIKYAP